jgi:hypothetical protein
MVQWMTRTSLEVLGQSALGYSFDPLAEDIVNRYVKPIKALS